MNKELAIRDDMMNLSDLGEVLVKSRFFSDTKDASQAIVKVLAGRELGIGPIASMTGIHIIQGKPSLGANVIASLVKGHPRYNYRVITLTEEKCVIAFYEGKEEIGQSSFEMADAHQAGLTNKDNWKKYPRNLLFARALSNGVRWFCPDVFLGAPVYTPEELGADVDDEGNVINGQFETEEPRQDSTRDRLLDRWEELAEEAQSLHIKVDELPNGITNAQIIEAGQAIAKLIENAKQSPPQDDREALWQEYQELYDKARGLIDGYSYLPLDSTNNELADDIAWLKEQLAKFNTEEETSFDPSQIPDGIKAKEFYTLVLKHIPYYNHREHIINAYQNAIGDDNFKLCQPDGMVINPRQAWAVLYEYAHISKENNDNAD